MKKEVKLLLEKAINSLMLSIEHFNRPWNSGRTDAVLILLDHSFEMLLKAAILHRGGGIRKSDAKWTIGFDECVRKALTSKKLKFLQNEEVLLLQSINSLRDAAQHHLVTISEQHLYIQAQGGLNLFQKVLKDVFSENLSIQLPERVLPISTTPPIDLITLFQKEVEEIGRLLQPSKRRNVEALAKLRGLAIVEGAMNGQKLQPSDDELKHISISIREGKSWDQIFPGVASINTSSTGSSPFIDIHITKNKGIQVQIVPEGTPGAAVIAVRKVDALSYYSLGRDQLAAKVGLSGPKTTAIIRYLQLQSDPECFKEFSIGKSIHQRYSQKAIIRTKDALRDLPPEEIENIWKKHGSYKKSKILLTKSKEGAIIQ